jgi:MoaA/NifB/PqqE/SkfB family radical SAM enzyme
MTRIRQAGFGLRYVVKMVRGRRAVLAHLRAPGPENLPMPTFVQLRLTNLCNLRCKMCGQWGDTGVFREHGNDSATEGEEERHRIRELVGLERQLGLADYDRLLDELAPHEPIISLFGGEPFLYPDILPLIRGVKRRGLTLTVITNGGLLERCARELVEAGIDSIAVSFDGPPDLHNHIRGQATSFQKAAAGVRAVVEWRKRLGRALPVLLAIFPITELNIEQAEAGFNCLRELPLDVINIGLRWFVPPEVGVHYEQVMREAFGVAATSWRGFEFVWPQSETGSRQVADLARFLKVLRRRRLFDWAAGPHVSFVPDVKPDDVPAYFSEHGRTFGHNLCPVAWYFAQVEPDGEVCFCGDFPDYSIGSVRSESFRAIWTGEKATAFRRKLAREPLPICARCCGSFIYGRWQLPERRREGGEPAGDRPAPDEGRAGTLSAAGR